jgi:hypothetical protein
MFKSTLVLKLESTRWDFFQPCIPLQAFIAGMALCKFPSSISVPLPKPQLTDPILLGLAQIRGILALLQSFNSVRPPFSPSRCAQVYSAHCSSPDAACYLPPFRSSSCVSHRASAWGSEFPSLMATAGKRCFVSPVVIVLWWWLSSLWWHIFKPAARELLFPNHEER